MPGATQASLARAATEEQAAHAGRQGGGRVWPFLRSADFDADCERLAAAGARLDGAPRGEVYARVVVFEDLYGNRWDLIARRWQWLLSLGCRREPAAGRLRRRVLDRHRYRPLNPGRERCRFCRLFSKPWVKGAFDAPDGARRALFRGGNRAAGRSL
ncbi:MAG: hypothetical protein MEQ07_10355 [Aquimonas sp.]|nr:hypothetical protein [Aquimonas sp.]